MSTYREKKKVLSQSVGEARWVRDGSINSCSLFLGGSCLCSTFCAVLITGFYLFCLGCALFSKIKSFVLGLSFDFLVFCDFVFRLESIFQKNNLSSYNLVLFQFGYRGFFLSHAVRLCFVVFSKLALVNLDYYIIPFQPG